MKFRKLTNHIRHYSCRIKISNRQTYHAAILVKAYSRLVTPHVYVFIFKIPVGSFRIAFAYIRPVWASQLLPQSTKIIIIFYVCSCFHNGNRHLCICLLVICDRKCSLTQYFIIKILQKFRTIICSIRKNLVISSLSCNKRINSSDRSTIAYTPVIKIFYIRYLQRLKLLRLFGIHVLNLNIHLINIAKRIRFRIIGTARSLNILD